MRLILRLVLADVVVSVLAACGDEPARAVDDSPRRRWCRWRATTHASSRASGDCPLPTGAPSSTCSDWDLRGRNVSGGEGCARKERPLRGVSPRTPRRTVFPALHAAAGPGRLPQTGTPGASSRAWPTLCACDALLLIIDDRRQLETDGAQYFQGYSWVGQAGVGGERPCPRRQAVVALRAVLVDARTQKVIAERRNDEPGGYPGVPRRRRWTRAGGRRTWRASGHGGAGAARAAVRVAHARTPCAVPSRARGCSRR